MKTHLSARVDANLARYLESYQQEHDLKTRSEALEAAIKALRDKALEHEYALAMEEWDVSGEAPLWDKTAGDGLDTDEAG
jgi:hypothetical protein